MTFSYLTIPSAVDHTIRFVHKISLIPMEFFNYISKKNSDHKLFITNTSSTIYRGVSTLILSKMELYISYKQIVDYIVTRPQGIV